MFQHRISILAFTALLALTVVSCGTDEGASGNAVAESEISPTAGLPTAQDILTQQEAASGDFAAAPEESPIERLLNRQEVFEQVQERFQRAASYEALFTRKITRADETLNQTSTIRFGGPGRVHVQTTTDDQFSELIGLGRTLYTRYGEPGQPTPETWSKFTVGGYASDFDEVGLFFQRLGTPDEVHYTNGSIILTGVMWPPIRRASGPPGVSIEFISGPYALKVDRATLLPVEAENEITVVRTFLDETGAETSTTDHQLLTFEFTNVDEPVLVDAPPSEVVIEAIPPTSTPIASN